MNLYHVGRGSTLRLDTVLLSHVFIAIVRSREPRIAARLSAFIGFHAGMFKLFEMAIVITLNVRSIGAVRKVAIINVTATSSGTVRFR